MKKKLINKCFKSMQKFNKTILKSKINYNVIYNNNYNNINNYIHSSIINNQFKYIYKNIISNIINNEVENNKYKIKKKFLNQKLVFDLKKSTNYIKKKFKFVGYKYKKNKKIKKIYKNKFKTYKHITNNYVTNNYYNRTIKKCIEKIYLNNNKFNTISNILNIQLSECNNNMRYTIFNKHKILHSKSIGSIRIDKIDKRKWRRKLGEYLAYWVSKTIRKYNYRYINIISTTKRKVIRLTYKKLLYYLRGKKFKMYRFLKNKKLNLLQIIYNANIKKVFVNLTKEFGDKIRKIKKVKGKMKRYFLFKKSKIKLKKRLLKYIKKKKISKKKFKYIKLKRKSKKKIKFHKKKP